MGYVADCEYQGTGFRAGSRRTRRSFVRMPATITAPVYGNQVHTAFVRDISPYGMFFYSNLRLEEGTRVGFVLEYAGRGSATRLHLSGVVKRVEGNRPGAAVVSPSNSITATTKCPVGDQSDRPLPPRCQPEGAYRGPTHK